MVRNKGLKLSGNKIGILNLLIYSEKNTLNRRKDPKPLVSRIFLSRIKEAP